MKFFWSSTLKYLEKHSPKHSIGKKIPPQNVVCIYRLKKWHLLKFYSESVSGSDWMTCFLSDFPNTALVRKTEMNSPKLTSLKLMCQDIQISRSMFERVFNSSGSQTINERLLVDSKRQTPVEGNYWLMPIIKKYQMSARLRYQSNR